MYEKPLERLNYFNGQRLEASDLKTEQDYHIRTRRWLNKSLYSAGIGRGLEVRKVPPDIAKKDPPRVGVSLGLAIDDDGREIILLEEALIEVCSYSGTGESTVVGNYLVIEYAEETLAFEKNGGCAVRETGARTSTSTTNFGGPARVQAKPKFSWIPFPPQPGSNQIALARVELGSDCTTVHQIDTGIRRYIGAASAAKVRQYALEGEREIAYMPKTVFPDPKPGDDQNKNVIVSGRIYFHIRGRQPSAVTLYLKAEEFSPLHYTELGEHTHLATVSGLTQGANPALTKEKTLHKHSPGTLVASGGDHENHLLTARRGYIGTHPNNDRAGFFLIEDGFAANSVPSTPELIFDDVKGSIIGGSHVHNTFSGDTKDSDGFDYDHIHTVSGTGSIASSGAAEPKQPGKKARSGKPLTFVSDLRIAIDGVDKTVPIRDQIVDSVPGSQKPAWLLGLGDGTSNHPLANEAIDAVPIRLDFLQDVTFSEGQHVIEFSVGLPPGGEVNGGKILYNLYIE